MKSVWNFFTKLRGVIKKAWKGIVVFFDKILPKPKPVVLENGSIVHPPRSAKIYISIILLVVIYFLTKATYFDEYIQDKVNYKPVLPNLNVLIYYTFRDLLKIFPFLGRFFSGFFDGLRFWTPEFQYWQVVLPKILETIRMAILGTFLGSALSLPVAYFISSNIHKNSRFGLFFINIAKGLLSLLRTFPMLIYASIILLFFASGSGALVGTIAIAIFTFSILTKMLYEYIETIDLGAFEAIESTGVTKGKAFTTAILPEIYPVYFSYALYCLDINVRHSTILGYVGAGGIGVILRTRLSDDDPERAGLIILSVFIAVLIIEGISKAIRKRLA